MVKDVKSTKNQNIDVPKIIFHTSVMIISHLNITVQTVKFQLKTSFLLSAVYHKQIKKVSNNASNNKIPETVSQEGNWPSGIRRYSGNRKDPCSNPTRFLSYIRQDLNYKMFQKYVLPGNSEIFALELKLSKSTWLLIGTYKPLSLNKITFISKIRKIHTYHLSKYGITLLIGDFNMTHPNLVDLISEYKLKTLLY